MPEPVRAAFARESYGLNPAAALTRSDYWAIADPARPPLNAVAYGTVRVLRDADALQVSMIFKSTGAVTVSFAARDRALAPCQGK